MTKLQLRLHHNQHIQHQIFSLLSWLLLLLCCSSTTTVVVVEAFSVVSSSSSSASAAATAASSSSSDDGKKKLVEESILTQVKEEHESQYQFGVRTFGCSSSDNDESDSDQQQYQQVWSDDDFIKYSVGIGNGGPSEICLGNNGHCIYETKQPILSDGECNYFINAAKRTIQNEKEIQLQSVQENNSIDKERRDWQRTNSDLGEARISNLPSEALEQIRSLLKTKLYPMLVNRFGLEDDNLTVYDGLILGSISSSISQPVHRDASLLTLNIALSCPHQDYTKGGGTYIEGLQVHNDDNNNHGANTPLRIDKGKVLCHSSGIMHAGTGIEGVGDERWVMVLFLISQNQIQIARRAHAIGLECIHTNQLDQAQIAFEIGLRHAPYDHLLHMGIGQVASLMKGQQNDKKSFACLDMAYKYYAASHKAGIAMGKILMTKRKYRGALRRFDRVLENINDEDLLDDAWKPLKAQGWDTRVCAARCALVCAEYEAARYDWTTREQKWTKANLPIAIDRIKTSLIPAPQNTDLLGMLHRAEELLADANEYPTGSTM